MVSARRGEHDGHKGRFKRSLLGYRPREVDEAIANREAALDEAKAKLAGAESRIGERDAELDGRRAELRARRAAGRRAGAGVGHGSRSGWWSVSGSCARSGRSSARARERGDESLRALTALADDLETVRRQARGQATRIRLRALREAAELTERIGELAGDPGEAASGLIESLQEAIRRIGAQSDEEEATDLAGLIAAANGHREREPGELFEGLVEVEVGPLSDFSQLVGFEDAAGGIGATSEISVKRFTQGRATLAMRFKQPVELLRELEERAPFEFQVRDTRSDRVVLDVDE